MENTPFEIFFHSHSPHFLKFFCRKKKLGWKKSEIPKSRLIVAAPVAAFSVKKSRMFVNKLFVGLAETMDSSFGEKLG